MIKGKRALFQQRQYTLQLHCLHSFAEFFIAFDLHVDASTTHIHALSATLPLFVADTFEMPS